MAPSQSPITSLSRLQVSRYLIPQHRLILNTSIQRHPLLIYHGAFPSAVTASAIESHLNNTGVVTPQWRDTMLDITHFHSTTHEVLCISRGRAQVCFGGEENPGKVEPVVQKGDVVVVPAGVGHRLLQDLDGEFEMVGAYPKGVTWDMCYGKEGEEDKVKSIEKLGWFDKDPVYGDSGPAIAPQSTDAS